MLTVSSKLIAKIKKVIVEQVAYIDTLTYRFKQTASVLTSAEDNAAALNDKKSDTLEPKCHSHLSELSTATSTELYSLVSITTAGEHALNEPQANVLKSNSSAKVNQTTQNMHAKIAILSRNCYHEQLQWYPISKKSDVLKLVKLQLQNSTTQVLYIVGNTVNDKTPVTYFYLNQYAQTQKAWLLIPETCLLANTLSPDQAISYPTVNNGNIIYVANSIGGAVSAIKGGVIQSLQQFSLSQGITAEQGIALTHQQHVNLLKTRLKTIYKMPLKGLVNRKVFTLTAPTKALSPFALPGLLIITLYLMLANQLSQYQANSVMSELTQVTKQANQVLNQYQDINDMIKRYQSLASNLPQSTNLLGVWQALAPLHHADNKLNIAFSSIQQDGDSVTARFTANSASQALQLLIQQPQVNNAKFVGSVRRQYNMDDATVQFFIRTTTEQKKHLPKNNKTEIDTLDTITDISNASPQPQLSEVQ